MCVHSVSRPTPLLQLQPPVPRPQVFKIEFTRKVKQQDEAEVRSRAQVRMRARLRLCLLHSPAPPPAPPVPSFFQDAVIIWRSYAEFKALHAALTADTDKTLLAVVRVRAI